MELADHGCMESARHGKADDVSARDTAPNRRPFFHVPGPADFGAVDDSHIVRFQSTRCPVEELGAKSIAQGPESSRNRGIGRMEATGGPNQIAFFQNGFEEKELL